MLGWIDRDAYALIATSLVPGGMLQTLAALAPEGRSAGSGNEAMILVRKGRNDELACG